MISIRAYFPYAVFLGDIFYNRARGKLGSAKKAQGPGHLYIYVGRGNTSTFDDRRVMREIGA